MIKINLLPFRISKKKETLKQQLIVLAVLLATAVAAMVIIFVITIGKISTAKSEIAKSENELQELKKKIGEIDNLKKLQAEVQKKLDVLNQLRKEKVGPATRLARISDIVPEKMWLTRYQETGTAVAISGLAYTEDLIADFMRSIQASPEFTGVDLQVSEQQEMNGIKLKRFDLSCALNIAKKEEPPKEQPKK